MGLAQRRDLGVAEAEFAQQLDRVFAQERRGPTAVLVRAAPVPPVPPAPAALAPEAEAAAQRADLDAAAADPGSTAGLLQWLAAQEPG